MRKLLLSIGLCLLAAGCGSSPQSGSDATPDGVASRAPVTGVSCGLLWRDNGDGVTINEYIGNASVVRIPDRIVGKPVTAIRVYAFLGRHNLQSIHIPDGVTSIGSGAFAHCYNLTSVILPAGLERIGWQTFGYCDNLSDVVFPEGLTRIRKEAFKYCKSLRSITLPASLADIEEDAFLGCYRLESVTLSRKTKVDKDAFRKDTRLTYRD